MRVWKPGLMCAAVALTALLSTGSFAQGGGGQGRGGFGGGPGRGGFGGRAASIANLPVSYLSWALNLNADQKAKIQAIQEKGNADMQALRQPDASGQRPDRATMQPKMQALNEQTKKDVEAVLTAAQLKKEASVVKEAGSYRSLGIPIAVVPDLKLTSAENAKLAEIAAEAAKEQQGTMQEIQAARQANDQQKMQSIFQTMQTSRKATQDKALAVLSDSQKAIVEKYQAAHPRPQRGGGCRRQGAGGPPAT